MPVIEQSTDERVWWVVRLERVPRDIGINARHTRRFAATAEEARAMVEDDGISTRGPWRITDVRLYAP